MTKPFLNTFMGVHYPLLDPTPEDVRIEDIAHGLANTVRFAGQCPVFYSVAQHSVLVSYIVGDGELGMYGLLHDAEEAYLGDLTAPLWHAIACLRVGGCSFSFELKKLWKKHQTNILQSFGLKPELPAAVKEADHAVCMRELAVFGNASPRYCDMAKGPANITIRPMDPNEAEEVFMIRFIELGGKAECSLDTHKHLLKVAREHGSYVDAGTVQES